MSWTVRCPAKVNLFLAVGAKDRRGYHPLRTIFQAIDLCDELRIEVATENFVTCDDPSVPSDNTLTKTLRLLREVVNLPPLHVHLVKNIPSEAGLGGGSSDAAGLIRATQVISRQTFPTAEMFGLAQTIGADVPFFLVGGLARAEGYGEKLTPLPNPQKETIVVVKPNVACGTAKMFEQLDATTYNWHDFPSDDRLYNDFERVAPCESLELIERLQIHGARDSGLTGSGSAVFGRFLDADAANAAVKALAAESDARAWVCQTMTREESLFI
ncbi:4-(cytidine 5'-diphospho)-2-C-methyl-D-erythritol kinase [soil metagenome]